MQSKASIHHFLSKPREICMCSVWFFYLGKKGWKRDFFLFGKGQPDLLAKGQIKWNLPSLSTIVVNVFETGLWLFGLPSLTLCKLVLSLCNLIWIISICYSETHTEWWLIWNSTLVLVTTVAVTAFSLSIGPSQRSGHYYLSDLHHIAADDLYYFILICLGK